MCGNLARYGMEAAKLIAGTSSWQMSSASTPLGIDTDQIKNGQVRDLKEAYFKGEGKRGAQGSYSRESNPSLLLALNHHMWELAGFQQQDGWNQNGTGKGMMAALKYREIIMTLPALYNFICQVLPDILRIQLRPN